MSEDLKIEIIRADQLMPDRRAAIYSLCNRAYEEDLEPLFETFTEATHVLGLFGSTIVSHAMWVTRWLQPRDGPLLRTAYVEMVATDPQFQRWGYATVVMRHLANAIHSFDLGALCPAEPEFYARLGWISWQGPLFIRCRNDLIPTPDEQIMILPLPKTPHLDVGLPLSAEWREGERW